DLIGWDSGKVTAADLTAVGQSAGPLIKKPEAHPLLHQVRFIQMLRQAQDSAQKVSADFDGRFANAPAERRAFLQDQDFHIRLVAEQKERGCRSRQSAADDGDVVGFSLHQSTRLMCKSLLSTLPSLAEIQTSPISASRVASRNLAAQSFAFHTGSPGPLWPSTPSPTRSSLSCSAFTLIFCNNGSLSAVFIAWSESTFSLALSKGTSPPVTGSSKRMGRFTSSILPAPNFTSTALSVAVGS